MMINFCSNISKKGNNIISCLCSNTGTLPTLKYDTFEKSQQKIEKQKSHKYYVELSKDISYALRHAPEECGITLDKQGYTTIEELLNYLNSTGKHGTVELSDLQKIITMFEKQRHEIKDDKIRALYGHSTTDKIIKEQAEPPKMLYHATSHEAAKIILEKGLSPQTRQYVHLTSDPKLAINAGKRKDKTPVLLKINSGQAGLDGYKFYSGNETVWLSDPIPPKYIEVTNEDI